MMFESDRYGPVHSLSGLVQSDLVNHEVTCLVAIHNPNVNSRASRQRKTVRYCQECSGKRKGGGLGAEGARLTK